MNGSPRNSSGGFGVGGVPGRLVDEVLHRGEAQRPIAIGCVDEDLRGGEVYRGIRDEGGVHIVHAHSAHALHGDAGLPVDVLEGDVPGGLRRRDVVEVVRGAADLLDLGRPDPRSGSPTRWTAPSRWVLRH